MKDFRFRAIGPEAGDCTTPYEVQIPEGLTVKEFVDWVLTRNEWGYIGIYNPDSDSFFGSPVCTYRHDKIDGEPFPDDIMRKTIKQIYAHGGWTNMDYRLTLSDEYIGKHEKGRK